VVPAAMDSLLNALRGWLARRSYQQGHTLLSDLPWHGVLTNNVPILTLNQEGFTWPLRDRAALPYVVEAVF